MHRLAGGTVFSWCNLRSITVFARTATPFYPKSQTGAQPTWPRFPQGAETFCSAASNNDNLCFATSPTSREIPFPATYSKRNIKLGRSGTRHSQRAGQPGSTVPMGDKLSLSSGLPSAETALSPSGLLQNTRLLIKHG